MSLSEARYLPDVNVLYALTTRDHIHHQIAKEWFYASPDLQWAVCAFTEAGYLRNATAPRPNQVTIAEATEILAELARHPGYHYLPISSEWYSLSKPLLKRL
jgi:uncharacterized protein